MEQKRVSYKVAKAIKEAGYPQNINQKTFEYGRHQRESNEDISC